MKISLLVRVLVLSGIATFGSVASASDELAGAFIGAGTGAVIGNAIDRQDGAIIGGIFGAILGAAIADNDDHRSVNVRHAPPPVRPVYERSRYQPAPVVVYPTPRPRYVAQPVFVEYRTAPNRWNMDRYDRRDQRWDRESDRRSDDRGNRNDRNDRNDRGGSYRNW